MRNLVASEFLKLRTTRAVYVYPVVLVALTGLAAAGEIGAASDIRRREQDFQQDLVVGSTFAGVLALIVGITAITGEFRHGTIMPSLLVSPVRERLLAAKALAAALVGLAFTVAGTLVVAAIAIPWLSALDVPLELADTDLWLGFGRIVLDAVIWGLLGVAVGGIVHSQVGALMGAILWLLLVEPLLGFLLGLIDLDFVAKLLLGPASSAITGSDGDENVLDFWPGLGVALAYVVVLSAAAVARTRARDVTG